MTKYDETTNRFVSDVLDKKADVDLSKEETKSYLQRQGLEVLKDAVTSPNPATLAKKIVRRGISAALTLPEMEKKSGLDLFEYMTDKYEDRWYHWEPETLWQNLEYDGITIDDELRNALQAYQVVTKTNAPFEEWHIFEKVGHAFNNNPVNFGHIQPLELDEIAYTVMILTTLRPKEEFEDEVKGYIAAAAKEAGVVYLPTDLFPEGCQEFLDELGNDLQLRDKVKRAYPGNGNTDTAFGIQLARLKEIDDYVRS